MGRSRHHREALAGAWLTLFSSCVAVGAPPPGEYGPLPSAANGRARSVALSVRASAERDRDELGLADPPAELSELAGPSQHFLRAFRTSELFTEVAWGDAPASLHVELLRRDECRPPKLLAASFLTLGLLPGRRPMAYRLEATFRDEHGTVLAECTANKRFAFVTHLLLLPFSPFFAPPAHLEERVDTWLARDVLEQAARKGLFAGSTP